MLRICIYKYNLSRGIRDAERKIIFNIHFVFVPQLQINISRFIKLPLKRVRRVES